MIEVIFWSLAVLIPVIGGGIALWMWASHKQHRGTLPNLLRQAADHLDPHSAPRGCPIATYDVTNESWKSLSVTHRESIRAWLRNHNVQPDILRVEVYPPTARITHLERDAHGHIVRDDNGKPTEHQYETTLTSLPPTTQA